MSNSSSMLTYERFKVWMEKHNILEGFNLTDALLQELFSELDPHKKGNVTETDWINAFGSFTLNFLS